MKISVICSAGGSSFFTAYRMLLNSSLISGADVLLLTDRSCASEEKGRTLGVQSHRLDGLDNTAFSRAAAHLSREHGARAILLLFSRLVTADLYSAIPTFNIHPSILPSFRGFGAIAKAKDKGVTILGATLHEAGEEADSGKIYSQVTSPLRRNADFETMERISFVQKAYLSMVFFEQVSGIGGTRVTTSASPALSSPDLIDAFREFLVNRPETVFEP